MKKLLLLLPLLCLTILLSACTKTFSEEDLEKNNVKDEILAIKSVNTFEEMITDDYEPKFEITNDYKQGDIPYLNFEFEGKDTVNNLMKAYALAVHSSDIIPENEYNIWSSGYAYHAEIETFNINTTNGRFIFVNVAIKDNGKSNHIEDTNFIAIDMTNKKLLNNKEVIETFNIDMDSALDELKRIMDEQNNNQRTDNYNYIENEYTDFKNRTTLYCAGKEFDETNISKYGKIINNYRLEIDVYGYGSSFNYYPEEHNAISRRTFKYNCETNQIELYEDYPYFDYYTTVTDKLN